MNRKSAQKNPKIDEARDLEQDRNQPRPLKAGVPDRGRMKHGGRIPRNAGQDRKFFFSYPAAEGNRASEADPVFFSNPFRPKWVFLR